VVLGIDPGLKCGWAVLDGGGVIVDCGLWRLDRGKESRRRRYWRLFHLLLDLLGDRPEIAVVAVELVMRHKGAAASHVYGAILGVIQLACEMVGVRCVTVAVSTIKKHATGDGRATKDKMLRAAKRRWRNVKFETDDVADAAWIASYVLEDEHEKA